MGREFQDLRLLRQGLEGRTESLSPQTPCYIEKERCNQKKAKSMAL